MTENFYSILGVSEIATADEIKSRYRVLIQAWHPDKFPGATEKQKAEEEFKRINEAYQVLSNPEQRAIYDARRRYNSAPPPPRQEQKPPAPPPQEPPPPKPKPKPSEPTPPKFEMPKPSHQALFAIILISAVVGISIYSPFRKIKFGGKTIPEPAPSPIARLAPSHTPSPSPVQTLVPTPTVVATPDSLSEFQTEINREMAQRITSCGGKQYVTMRKVLYEIVNLAWRPNPDKLLETDKPEFNNVRFRGSISPRPANSESVIAYRQMQSDATWSEYQEMKRSEYTGDNHCYPFPCKISVEKRNGVWNIDAPFERVLAPCNGGTLAVKIENTSGSVGPNPLMRLPGEPEIDFSSRRYAFLLWLQRLRGVWEGEGVELKFDTNSTEFEKKFSVTLWRGSREIRGKYHRNSDDKAELVFDSGNLVYQFDPKSGELIEGQTRTTLIWKRKN